MATQQAAQVPQGAFTKDTLAAVLLGDFTLYAASGAIDPHASERGLITKATAAAMTLAAPAVGADDGKYKLYVSTTAAAHTITATGLFQDGAGHVNTATFAAQIGASIELMAFQGKWIVLSTQGVTMS